MSGSLVAVLGVSLAYNLWPVSPIKMALARLDQAAIFLFIAGTYTPFLAVLGGTPVAIVLTVFVWGASLIGIALKLIVPRALRPAGDRALSRHRLERHFRVPVAGPYAAAASALAAGRSGGIVYSLGIIFHLWEKLKFQNVLWHVFVVAGACLHLWAVLDTMVISRL